jgi:hypothetical protein
MQALDVEALVRLDLKPGEVLTIIPGVDLYPSQMREVEEYVTERLRSYGMPVDGVLVLPMGSQIAALTAADAQRARAEAGRA